MRPVFWDTGTRWTEPGRASMLNRISAMPSAIRMCRCLTKMGFILMQRLPGFQLVQHLVISFLNPESFNSTWD